MYTLHLGSLYRKWCVSPWKGNTHVDYMTVHFYSNVKNMPTLSNAMLITYLKPHNAYCRIKERGLGLRMTLTIESR